VSNYRVAVDVGGTFTDVFVLDEDTADVNVAKVPSTPHDPMEAIMNGVAAANVDLENVTLFSHGTTVATNALITRRFPPVAMVTTRGFRDVLEIRRGTRDDLWDAYNDVAPAIIPRRDRLEVSERIDYEGRVLEPLDEAQARQVAAKLRARGVETVAVCFINAYANPANENRMREILEEELPGVSISTSSEILPEIFEYERFSTTVANAVLSPLVGGYVQRLGQRLKDGGYRGDLLLLHSGGGVMTEALVQKYAVRLAASGIAAGAIACQRLAALCGYENAIGLDMGGTSTDISLVYGGEMRTTKEWSVEYGHPICFPSIEILTIGAGGGSLAWIDQAGSLRNGPQSAGADPGPACYRRGGDQPTNTDANLVLGRLGTELVGGAMTLDHVAAEEVIREGVGEPLGLDLLDAASAVIQVANANMADAVRLISIRRGYDPRDFALVAFGGAGALHGAALARELSIPTVLVPPNPGITSALGCLLVDVRHDLATMYLRPLAEADAGEIEAEFVALEDAARERMREEGVADADVSLQRTIAMRYLGQWRSLAVPIEPGASLDDAVAAFHDQHEREFTYRREDAPVEIYQLGLRAIGVTPKPEFTAQELAGRERPAQPYTTRPAKWDEYPEMVATPIYKRQQLLPGQLIAGPAVIEGFDSTVVVPPNVTAEVDEWEIIRMQILEAQS
jgi:N-methylhydantoinase A